MRNQEKVKENGIVSLTRKIIKISGSHYICLPKQFIAKHNLEKGDEVGVISDTICKVIPMTEQ